MSITGPIPIDELNDQENCHKCGQPIGGQEYYYEDEQCQFFCSACGDVLLDEEREQGNQVEVTCTACGSVIGTEYARLLDSIELRVCSEQCRLAIESHEETAEGYVTEHFKIRLPLPTYNPGLVTLRQYTNECRHQYTNYDSLILGLGRHDSADRVEYNTIKAHIMRTLRQEIEKVVGQIPDDQWRIAIR